MEATITERGQVSIPAELRREMDLHPGQTVLWEQISATECRIVVQQRILETSNAVAAIGFASRHGLAGGTSEEWMTRLREGED